MVGVTQICEEHMSKLTTLFSQSFHPQKIPNLQLWLDAAYTSTITKDGSDKVSQWNDKSGNGYHATQGVGASQPTWVDFQQNNKAILTFDGGDDLLLPSGIYSIPNGENTVIMIAKRSSEDATTDIALGMGVDGVTNKYFISYSPVSGQIDFRSSTGSGSTVNGGSTNTEFNIILGRRLGTNVALSVNGGVESTSSTGADTGTIDIARIGMSASGSLRLDGSIAEIMIFDRFLTPVEIDKIEKYLSNKWDIAL